MSSRDVLLFPGCALEGAGKEYGQSAQAVLEVLGRPIQELEDWNCCGASAARSVERDLTTRLCARNLALAAKQDCDVMVLCAACYNNLAFSRQYLVDHGNTWPQSVADSSAPPPESVNVHHLLTLLTSEEMLGRLGEKVTRPLDDLRLACYYGCLLVRPGGYTQVDDPENPQKMDVLMRLCGAETVDWSYKTDCCGASSALTDNDMAVRLLSLIFDDVIGRNATAIVTACPLCQMNLDTWQRRIGKALGREVSIPVYYITELLAAAMDLPDISKWLKGHMTKAGAGGIERR